MLIAHAPAKTNLFLEVLGKRADGYHELDTIFVELDVCDRLRVTDDAPPGGLIVVATGDPTVPNGEQNLVYRAVDRLRARAGRPSLAVRIVIEKKIPAGGGLGGGSSDAAVALLAVNELFSLGLGEDALAAIASEVGSDCAFFVRGGLQRGRGRGERLEPLAPIARPLDLVLVLPEASVPTKTIYSALAPYLADEGEKPAARAPDALLAALARGDVPAIGRELWNRLEGPCFELFPAVLDAKRALERLGLAGALLSGSGATVFGLARDRDEAERAARKLASDGLRAIAVRAGARRGSLVVAG